ncbi:MAG: DUF1080 domain-containing protein [Cyclobacteriaceae bacterium]|nr:DUF1080 domain-containing protein [Cyclobacteriaceae bacterium]
MSNRKGSSTCAGAHYNERKIVYPGIYLNILLLIMTVFTGCSTQQAEKADWTVLFNGKDLTGWDTWLAAPRGNSENQKPYGLNNDPEQIFTIVEEDGQPAIRIAGDIGGGISTVNEFENYHLSLEFKWGEAMPWADRKKRDSGLLYHATGPHGADGGYWMRSQEFQVQEGDCGDYWGVAGGLFDIPARLNADSVWVYDKNSELLTFKEGTETGRHCIKDPDAEKPTGEWNTLELYCLGGTSVHIVNGVVTMVLYNSRQADDSGPETPLTKGKIQLQSEGAELFYRDLKLRTIETFPAGIIGG